MKARTAPNVNAWDGVEGQDIAVGTQQWFEWLETTPNFHYRDSSSDFLVRKRGKNYWYAYKRFMGEYRQEYLGKTSALTGEKLQQVSRLIGDYSYKTLKADLVTAKQADLVVHRNNVQQLENKPSAVQETCTTNSTITTETHDELLNEANHLRENIGILTVQLELSEEIRGKAIDILTQCLPLPANKGGAIKARVKDVLSLLGGLNEGNGRK